MSNKKKIDPRVLITVLFTAAVFAVFAVMLARIQLVSSGADSTNSGTETSYDVTVGAARGEILDRNGNTFVYNEQINTIIFTALQFPSENADRNEVILSLINYLESKNEEWTDRLPLNFAPDGTAAFEEDRETDIKWLKSEYMLNMNPYATAQNCYDGLCEEFGLSGYSKSDALKIASVRYSMRKNGFSASTPYTFAEGVSIQTIAYIKENSDFYRGVDVEVASARKYVGDGSLASHLLGIVGAINSDEYNEAKLASDEALAAAETEEEKAELRAKAYSLNDKIGKSGLEQAMEQYLRGTNGIKSVTKHDDGTTTEEYKVLPQTGGTVITTLDQPMQEIAERSLKKRIGEVSDYAAIANGLTLAGAVVVEDVKTGAVLASATYPTFSLATYYDEYSELAENPGKPLWNRAFQSGYSPGSTMKPATGIAALEEGVMTPDSVVYCGGVYKFIDQTFVCFNKNAHGAVNIKTALAQSCNIYFFECAKGLGIEKMNRYASLLGLGQKTGIEIAETAGILAGIDYRDSVGQGWKIGESLLAAIGQSDNSFSPLQLTNYCATIANGGTRYVPYLVSKILSSDYSKTLYQHDPEIAAQTNFSKPTLDAIKDGMYLVANTTSCRDYLGRLKYKVACKTGTAEKTRIINGRTVEGTDGFLIAFGPFDDPEIAITVVIENAGSGSSTAQVAADIFNYYFSTLNTVKGVQEENILL